ncbi:hypothetical protein [Pseudoclavibacter soli]|uniref:hypothetical protein n=1 Tax=Pseudoclavibacter soli TaxID=452623 RepID=UPI00041E0193|nr:hypothetical protein [Pseudoclavibacter soli]
MNRPADQGTSDVEIDRALLVSALDRVAQLPLEQRAAEYQRLYDDLSHQLDVTDTASQLEA